MAKPNPTTVRLDEKRKKKLAEVLEALSITFFSEWVRRKIDEDWDKHCYTGRRSKR